MRPAAVVTVLAASALLAGCTPTVTLKPAPQATSVGCAGVVARLPQTIAAADRRETDAQGTAAWGTPATTLVCGVRTPEVSALPCSDVGGVDWLVQDAEVGSEESTVFTTYGRSPGVQIVVPPGSLSRSDVLPAVSEAVDDATRRTGHRCLAAADVPTPAATPTSATPTPAT